MLLTKTTPYEHQRQAYTMAGDRTCFAYLMEQGTGKSLCFIADFTKLYLDGKINCVVIVAPKGCYLNWQRDELPKHVRADIPYRVETWVSPSKQGVHKVRRLESFASVQMPYLKILLVNVEALAFASTYAYLAPILRSHSTIMAVDESTFIRTASAKRCLYARRLGALAKFRRILTGTPIANRPLDLYGQFCFLDPKLLGFPTYQTFKHYYADIGYFRGGKRLDPEKESIYGPGVFQMLAGYRHLDELTSALNRHSFRVLKRDCLDLPEKVYETRYVELTSQQRKMYDSMAKTLLASFESGEFSTAQIALTKLMRLQTILCGHLKTDDGEVRSIENNRIGIWKDLCEEIDGKIITYCLYREDIKQLIKDLPPGSYAEYHGGNVNTRQEDKERWQTDPLCKYLFVTAKAGGTGLTLNESWSTVYYSQGYDLEMRQQSEDRNHRIGQTHKVTYYTLCVPDTVDEVISKALTAKQNLADTVLLNLRSYLQPELPRLE